MTIKVKSSSRASSRHRNPLTVVYSTGAGLTLVILASFGFPQETRDAWFIWEVQEPRGGEDGRKQGKEGSQ